MLFPFITYGMALCINDSTLTKHYHCEKSVYMRASLEIFGIFT